jgi:hypothetical protein
MSRQLMSRANQVFFGRAVLGSYQTGKPGGEVNFLYRFRPAGNRAATASAGLSAGATSLTLSGNWGGASGIYPITFSDGETLNGIFTNGATTCPFLPASFPQTGGNYGGAGALVNAVTSAITVGGQPPILGVANSILTSSAITAGTPAVLNGTIVAAGVATLDVARNIVAAWTTTSVMTVTGTDIYGQVQTESSASGTTFTGKKTFATITAVNVSISVTAATVGSGNVLGLPFRAASGDIMAMYFNDATDASTFVKADVTQPATSTTGDVRGTVAPAGTLNGSSFFNLLIKPYDSSSQVGLFGVTPA